AAFHLLDHAPGDGTHGLALDRHHGVGELADDLALLFLAENVFDDANLNERHWFSPLTLKAGWRNLAEARCRPVRLSRAIGDAHENGRSARSTLCPALDLPLRLP